jgi:hypothetical protein
VTISVEKLAAAFTSLFASFFARTPLEADISTIPPFTPNLTAG